jgi:hypothetical protein
MILHGIEVTKFKWNDKEVSEEEYLALNEEWKQKTLEESEPPEKKSRNTKSSRKKFRNPSSGLKK